MSPIDDLYSNLKSSAAEKQYGVNNNTVAKLFTKATFSQLQFKTADKKNAHTKYTSYTVWRAKATEADEKIALNVYFTKERSALARLAKKSGDANLMAEINSFDEVSLGQLLVERGVGGTLKFIKSELQRRNTETKTVSSSSAAKQNDAVSSSVVKELQKQGIPVTNQAPQITVIDGHALVKNDNTYISPSDSAKPNLQAASVPAKTSSNPGNIPDNAPSVPAVAPSLPATNGNSLAGVSDLNINKNMPVGVQTRFGAGAEGFVLKKHLKNAVMPVGLLPIKPVVLSTQILPQQSIQAVPVTVPESPSAAPQVIEDADLIVKPNITTAEKSSASTLQIGSGNTLAIAGDPKNLKTGYSNANIYKSVYLGASGIPSDIKNNSTVMPAFVYTAGLVTAKKGMVPQAFVAYQAFVSGSRSVSGGVSSTTLPVSAEVSALVPLKNTRFRLGATVDGGLTVESSKKPSLTGYNAWAGLTAQYVNQKPNRQASVIELDVKPGVTFAGDKAQLSYMAAVHGQMPVPGTKGFALFGDASLTATKNSVVPNPDPKPTDPVLPTYSQIASGTFGLQYMNPKGNVTLQAYGTGNLPTIGVQDYKFKDNFRTYGVSAMYVLGSGGLKLKN